MVGARAARGAAALVLLLVACEPSSWLPLRANPAYCDDTTPCSGGLACDIASRECRAIADMASPADLVSPECAASAQCPAARPICEQGRCRVCAGDGDDAACGARDAARAHCRGDGQCVACREDVHCPVQTPVCTSDGTCRPCQRNVECSLTGVCRDDGLCEPQGSISFVDKGEKTTADCLASGVHDGTTPATPFCEIQAAIDANPPRPVIKIANGTYDAFTINRSGVRIVGPGLDGFRPGQFTVLPSGKAAPAITLPANRKIVATVEDLRMTAALGASVVVCSSLVADTVLTLRGVHAQAAAASALFAELECALVVRDSRVTASRAGIEASGARITVERTTIDGNGTGASIHDQFVVDHYQPSDATIDATQLRGNDTAIDCRNTSSCRVSNSVLAGNGQLDRGLGGAVFDTSGVALLDLSTIVGNLTVAGANGAGVTCVRPATVRSSIVYGNRALGGAQVGAACLLVGTVTGSGDQRGIRLDPAFVAYGQLADLRLAPGSAQNRACCVDKAQPLPDAAYNDHDANGGKRPLGLGHDVGAFEAE